MMLFDKDLPYNTLPNLPTFIAAQTDKTVKLTIKANKLLAELKGYCQVLPNPELLLNTIILQESKESNAIENIVTTQDELYKASLYFTDKIKNSTAKEVIRYRESIYWGLEKMQKTNLITTNLMIGIMQNIRNTQDNIRKNTGTKLINPNNNTTIYTPPEGEELIRKKLAALEIFINNDDHADLDPLIKMALIHYQFEAIHPFGDGNGRTGRIINVLYLINKELLQLPILYLSRYVIQNKTDYYRLLKEVTENKNWIDWIHFILEGVGQTAATTLQKIKDILALKQIVEATIEKNLKTSNANQLADLIFSHPYIKVSVLEQNNIAKRQTAANYLKKIEEIGLLHSVKVGKEVYYINHQLMKILSE